MDDEPEATFLARVLPFLPAGSWIERATAARLAGLAGLAAPAVVSVRAGGLMLPWEERARVQGHH